MFHGTEDEIIPFDSSEKLVAINPQRFELVTLRNEGHRGVIFDQVYRSRVSEVLQRL